MAHQVLFSGLPPDVTENDLKDILFAQPLSLPSTTRITCFYNLERVFLGMALVSVGNEVDAERIRLEYSGQLIDNTYRLMVQHLSSSPAVKAKATPPPAPKAAIASRLGPGPKAAPPTKPAPKSTPGPKPTPASASKPPGLQLLARIKGNEQQALLARQKANLKRPPKDLLSRLAKQKPNKPTKPAPSAKVNRAKVAANKPEKADTKPRKEQPRGKTQEELDAEMVKWERARRFGA